MGLMLNRNPVKVPMLVESLLGEVTDEFERCLATQNESNEDGFGRNVALQLDFGGGAHLEMYKELKAL
ncbi:hypothetical protein C5167_026307 [Papaver somniferum]|nr:hypothetical protein C5167_026307 [Papaver somniferum]